jgi:hypothetical protein
MGLPVPSKVISIMALSLQVAPARGGIRPIRLADRGFG